MKILAFGSRIGPLFAVPLLLVALVACSGGSAGDMFAGARTLTVGSSSAAEFALIQQAVQLAPAGSTILIEAGVYTELVYINKPLTLTGAGPGTVVAFPTAGQPDSAVIEIRDTAGVRIESLSVRASPLMVDGIRVRGSTSVVLLSIVASNNSGDGIDIRGSQGVQVVDGICENNGGDGVQVDENSTSITVRSTRMASNFADGIKVRNSNNVLVEGNTSTLNLDDGILVRSSTSVRLVQNESISNTNWGIRVINAPDTVLDGNTSTGNGAGNVRCEPVACP